MSEKEINHIIEKAQSLSKMSEDRLYFSLGVSVFYERLTEKNVKASAPYKDIGLTFYKQNKKKIYSLICNKKTKKPKTKFLNSNAYALALALVGDYSGGVAAALIAILIKKGLDRFCKLSPR